MRYRAPRILISLAIVLCAELPLAARQEVEFPPAAAGEVGVDATALEELAGVVAGFVDEQRVAGAELLVVKNRRTVLRRAFGLADREAKTPLELGAYYNIRSMTKPIVATAAQLFIDEGRLDPAVPVSTILPEFGREGCEEITVFQLLTHRAGFEWSACMSGDSLRELARCAAELGPTLYYPGASFLYSNTGSNVLGAVLAEMNGTPLEELVEARILRPLALKNSFSLASADEARLARCVTCYAVGDDGELERVWSPTDGAPLPFLQGAQGLASTTTDYARFLTLWMDGGEPLLSPEAIARGLRPASLTELPTTFPDRRVYYGQHWKLWLPRDSNRLEIFGHGGSDGTFAWAFPEQDLIVLYFTQTVLTPTGIELEEEIDRLLLSPGIVVPAALRPYVGHYWSEKESMVRVVSATSEGDLSLDVVGTGSFTLKATDDPLRWEIPGREGFDVLFERDDGGAIAVLVPPPSTGETASPRLLPAPELPSVDELMALRPPSPATLGFFRMTGHFWKDAEESWKDVLYSDGARRSREEVYRSKKYGPQTTVCNGARAVTISSRGKRREVTGRQRDNAILGRLAVLLGDWREYFERVEVLARTERDDRPVYVVQAMPKEGWPVYYVVDAESGLALQQLRTLELPIGSMGKISTFGDYREIDGVMVPFHWEGRFASKSLGTWELKYEEIETQLELDEALFDIEGP